jgi:hypothetical protein
MRIALQLQFLLVTSDEINSDEGLSVQLWDSDKYVPRPSSLHFLRVCDPPPADVVPTISLVAWSCPSKS